MAGVSMLIPHYRGNLLLLPLSPPSGSWVPIPEPSPFRGASSQWLTERAFHSLVATSRFSQAHRMAEPRNPLDSPHRMAQHSWPVPHHLESSTPQHSSRCRT